MFLKRLEIYGFKSFAEKTILEFKPGITAVIGPNGSGKSNVSDCIRWILGEQSLKSLRGAKTEDIIFTGTEARRALGYAEGSIVLDNSDGSLPIDYNEVTITRRLYRNNETGYFINRSSCRLKDIIELFMDTGIGKDGYSIIGQGKIDEILSNKSEDRRKVFEEAAGIVKYKSRKEESEKKLEQTRLNILRINDIISEIETSIDPLREQSEKANKYLNLREELKNKEIGLFLFHIEKFKSQIEEATANIDILETQRVKEDIHIKNLQDEKENLKERIEKIINDIEEIQNKNLEGKQKKEQFSGEIAVLNQKKISNKDNFDRYKADIVNVLEKEESFNKERLERIQKKESISKERDSIQKELDGLEKELLGYTKNLSEKDAGIEEKKNKLSENINLKYELSAEIKAKKSEYENIEKNEINSKSVISNMSREIDDLKKNKTDDEAYFLSLEKDVEELLIKIDKQSKKADKKSDVDSRINSLESLYRINESKIKFIEETEKEKDIYSKTTKALLDAIDKDDNLSKGVCGVLADLISTEKKYEIAIEMALGGTLQNIVTETENEAKKLIKYLRQNNLGRASFLPLSLVRKKEKIEDIKEKGKGTIGVASDLVKTDDKYKDMILSLLGNTVVVESLDDGIILSKDNSYKFKIVTLEGDVINQVGRITGGSTTKRQVSLLGRKREIDKINKSQYNLNEEINKLKSEKEKYIIKQNEEKNKLETLKNEYQKKEIEYETKKQNLLMKKNEIIKREKELEEYKDSLKNTAKEKEENLKAQSVLYQKLNSIENENEALNKFITEELSSSRENKESINNLNTKITDLKISISSYDENIIAIDEFITRVDNDISNCKNDIEIKESLINEIEKDNSNIEKDIINIGKNVEKIEKQIVENDEKTRKLKLERSERQDKETKLEEDILFEQNKFDDIKSKISRLDLKKSKSEFELEQIQNKMWEEYELTPNNVNGIEKAKNISETQKNVDDIKEEIKNLGSINVDAIEQYKETKNRYEFMCNQREDLNNSSEKLKNVINEMIDTMKIKFSEQFSIINKNFGEVFKELFGGGKAELRLEDEKNILESGIEISVQPPGKKLQNMMLLSGGERAFTAIALLFAILEMNPAPFCVLDEIEAALDDVNVYRFAEYLKKFSNRSQFLVITHRKGTMEAADTVYGITMEEKGVSKLLSMSMK